MNETDNEIMDVVNATMKAISKDQSGLTKVEKQQLRAYINAVIRVKGEDWIIAALVDGSIGYYTPSTALNVVQWFKEGHDTHYSERAMTCFQTSVLKELKFDIACFESTEKLNPEKAKKIVQWVEKAKHNTDTGYNFFVTTQYPTSV